MVLIESNDSVFAEKIATTLDQWGFRHRPLAEHTALAGVADEAAVALLDVRDVADAAFSQVYSIRQQYSGLEVILINRPDNVVASIAGMKAGAVDEIMVPIDTATLRGMITEASARVQAARAQPSKKPLLTRFSEAMMAATFAQAGDFEGALDLLDTPAPKRTGQSASKKKDSGS